MKTKNTQENKKRKNTAIKTLKEIINIYKKYYPIILEKNKKIPGRKKASQAFSFALEQKSKYKAKKCNHCLTKANNQKSLCFDCNSIPKCKECGIIMGYWNQNKTELIYNQNNKPSNTNPDICENCIKK